MVLEQRKKEYVKNFVNAASETWGNEIEDFMSTLEATAEAVWYLEGVNINPEDEPATLPWIKRYVEKE